MCSTQTQARPCGVPPIDLLDIDSAANLKTAYRQLLFDYLFRLVTNGHLDTKDENLFIWFMQLFDWLDETERAQLAQKGGSPA